jgi:hypothetical protein
MLGSPEFLWGHPIKCLNAAGKFAAWEIHRLHVGLLSCTGTPDDVGHRSDVVGEASASV